MNLGTLQTSYYYLLQPRTLFATPRQFIKRFTQDAHKMKVTQRYPVISKSKSTLGFRYYHR